MQLVPIFMTNLVTKNIIKFLWILIIVNHLLPQTHKIQNLNLDYTKKNNNLEEGLNQNRIGFEFL